MLYNNYFIQIMMSKINLNIYINDIKCLNFIDETRENYKCVTNSRKKTVVSFLIVLIVI